MLILTFGSVQAQFSGKEDVITMRDGTVYRGDIAYQIPDSIVVLNMVGGSRLILSQHEVETIQRGEHRYKRIKYFINRNRKPMMVRNRGLASHLSLQFYPRENQWGGTSLNAGMHYSLNYRFSHQLAAGLGLGIEGFEGGAGMPFYLNVSGDLSMAHVTPTYFVRSGYMLGVAPSWQNQSFEGGWMNEAGIGIKYRTRSRLEWVAGLGYRRQPVTETRSPLTWWDPNPTPDPEIVPISRVFSSLFLHYSVYF